jgi:hypothetical protein
VGGWVSTEQQPSEMAAAAEVRVLFRALLKEGQRCPNYNIRVLRRVGCTRATFPGTGTPLASDNR